MGPGAMRMGQAALAEGEQGRRYDGVARTFHWAIVVLLLVQYGTKLIPASWANENLTDAWHIAVGPAILLLMVLRLGWRLTHRPPPAPTDLPAALRLLSRATHWAFYALLIVLPVLGWVSASGFGARPSIFGLVPLPMLIGMDKAAAMAWGGAHGALAWALLAVIALHVSGALYHALIKRDGVLGRMA